MSMLKPGKSDPNWGLLVLSGTTNLALQSESQHSEYQSYSLSERFSL